MLRYKTKTRPGLVALYDIRPGNGAGPFLQPRSPHGARRAGKNWWWLLFRRTADGVIASHPKHRWWSLHLSGGQCTSSSCTSNSGAVLSWNSAIHWSRNVAAQHPRPQSRRLLHFGEWRRNESMDAFLVSSTLCFKKIHVTTSSTITWTASVRL